MSSVRRRCQGLCFAVLGVLVGGLTACSQAVPCAAPAQAPRTLSETRVQFTGVLGDAVCPYPNSEAELEECLTAAYRQSEDRMSELLNALRPRAEYQPQWVQELLETQSLWEAYRKAECGVWTYDSRDGTAFGSYWLECLITMNRQRITTLEYLEQNP